MASSCMTPVNHCQRSVMQLSPHESSTLPGTVCMAFAFISLPWRWLQCVRCIVRGRLACVDASVEQERDHPLSFHRDKDNRGHSWGLSAAGLVFCCSSQLWFEFSRAGSTQVYVPVFFCIEWLSHPSHSVLFFHTARIMAQQQRPRLCGLPLDD